MNAFLRKVATVCVAFLLCASMGTIAFANDLPIYSEWAKAEVSAAENEGLLPFEMYDDCRRALHRDWATAFLVKFVEIATNASIGGSDVQVFDDVPIGHTMFEDINKAYGDWHPYMEASEPATEDLKARNQNVLHLVNYLESLLPKEAHRKVEEYIDAVNNRYTAELDYAYMVGFQTAFRMMLLGITDPELLMAKFQPTADS